MRARARACAQACGGARARATASHDTQAERIGFGGLCVRARDRVMAGRQAGQAGGPYKFQCKIQHKTNQASHGIRTASRVPCPQHAARQAGRAGGGGDALSLFESASNSRCTGRRAGNESRWAISVSALGASARTAAPRPAWLTGRQAWQAGRWAG